MSVIGSQATIAPEVHPTVVATPVTLNVPSINVSVNLNPVGLTPEGDMDIDANPEQAAWYKLGAKPGEKGSAVIAGHYGWKNNIPAAFNDLNKLKIGDELSTVDEDGKVVSFLVSHSALYSPEQDATDVFKSNDGKAHLNLITCQGSWDDMFRTYTQRLVIFTDLKTQ